MLVGEGQRRSVYCEGFERLQLASLKLCGYERVSLLSNSFKSVASGRTLVGSPTSVPLGRPTWTGSASPSGLSSCRLTFTSDSIGLCLTLAGLATWKYATIPAKGLADPTKENASADHPVGLRYWRVVMLVARSDQESSTPLAMLIT